MRLKKSIFTKLMGSFILYVVILFFTFAVYLLLEAVLIGKPCQSLSLSDY